MVRVVPWKLSIVGRALGVCERSVSARSVVRRGDPYHWSSGPANWISAGETGKPYRINAFTVAKPLSGFFKSQAAGGILLLVCAGAALVAANSGLAHRYHDLWDTRVAIGAGGRAYRSRSISGSTTA